MSYAPTRHLTHTYGHPLLVVQGLVADCLARQRVSRARRVAGRLLSLGLAQGTFLAVGLLALGPAVISRFMACQPAVTQRVGREGPSSLVVPVFDEVDVATLREETPLIAGTDVTSFVPHHQAVYNPPAAHEPPPPVLTAPPGRCTDAGDGPAAADGRAAGAERGGQRRGRDPPGGSALRLSGALALGCS
jgi:hypothetical protein